jgi:integrase
MGKRLTAISVQATKPRSTRFEVPDAACRGLYLITQPSGRKSFAVRYRFNGKTKKLTLDAGLSLAAARKAATDALHKLDLGSDPASAKKAARAEAEIAAGNTLRAVAELYLKLEEAKPTKDRLRTIGQRRSVFERLIYPVLGGRPVGEIRRSDIVKLLDAVALSSGARMADEVLVCLRILFGWHAVRDDDFRSPIVKGMARTKAKDRMRNHTLSHEELVRIWRAADDMGPFGSFVQFLLLTATRRNEAARMTRSEVTNCEWLIPAARYKSKRDHLVPLSRAAQAILAKMPEIADCKFVFTGDGRHAIAASSRLKAKLDKASGVTGWRLHDLRRTARTLMSEAGANPDHAERCLGHALPSIRGTYDVHAYRAEKQAVFEALAARIERIVNPPAGDNVVPLRA